ncbi:hypothetical protein Naga_100034g40 [Nannochloropsis gaditana]|uniref:Uncharacterized protein n=1 Tax=Nannochloropsis gaditana TaxID=72520 RepID=W7U4S0_9STRA|nr:hypothetical protein Naga_100034g40 [Nannochloropsis gaditana]
MYYIPNLSHSAGLFRGSWNQHDLAGCDGKGAGNGGMRCCEKNRKDKSLVSQHIVFESKTANRLLVSREDRFK